jgi:hypothetical protein
MLCLVGGVALAARFGNGGGGAAADTSPATLGRGATGGWRLSAYRDRGRLCLLFTLGEGKLSSECGPAPDPDKLRATSIDGQGHRFVIGLAGAQVSTVSVRVGDRRSSGSTKPAVDPAAAREAGVPDGTRWFVLALDHDLRAPAHVLAFGRDHRRLGPAYVDCSLGVVGRACQWAIRARAREAAHAHVFIP